MSTHDFAQLAVEFGLRPPRAQQPLPPRRAGAVTPIEEGGKQQNFWIDQLPPTVRAINRVCSYDPYVLRSSSRI